MYISVIGNCVQAEMEGGGWVLNLLCNGERYKNQSGDFS